jgi:ribosome recycling factor
MDVIKKGKDGKLEGISKDDAFASGKEIDNIAEHVMDKLKAIIDEKMNSIMAV